MMLRIIRVVLVATLLISLTISNGKSTLADEPLRLATFDVDASPTVGSRMAYDETIAVETPLRCTGIVLKGSDLPVVLCAVDWIGIGNEGYRVFRERLAIAAGTTADRVALHSLHQHDAPYCDFAADMLATQAMVTQKCFDSAVAREVIAKAEQVVAVAARSMSPVTHVGMGRGRVEKVASNRRILGPDGKVKSVRYTASKDPELQAAPEGVIDSELKAISFWNHDRRLCELTWYATHPQSYYRTGRATPDYPGLARDLRQKKTGVVHIHFTGAGGNIGAGKYNDGSPEQRPVLTQRMVDGMELAWNDDQKMPVTASDLSWQSLSIALPVSASLNEEALVAELNNAERPGLERSYAAAQLAWVRRCKAGDTIEVNCLSLGKIRVVGMPGELFVEYQLAAQQLRPDLFVALAAYGDYGPWYIGTTIAYQQGGYETGHGVSLVAPECESVLVAALEKLLQAPKSLPERLGVSAARAETEAAQPR